MDGDKNISLDDPISELEALAEMCEKSEILEQEVHKYCGIAQNLVRSNNLSKARESLTLANNTITKYIQSIMGNRYLSADDLDMYECKLKDLWELIDKRNSQIDKLEAQSS